MQFQHTHYTRQIKIQSRCFVKEAVEAINDILTTREKRWFHNHPQFKHFFHMHVETKNKVQGMWMLILHTANLASRRQAWFIVNGVPIRYSIREHGLISGLYCHNYPLQWQRLGSTNFVGEQFGCGTTITYADVKKMFLEMKGVEGITSGKRLRMAVLYFLCSVISGKARRGEGAPSVDPFFLRACSDLELCKTFPWGRFSYDDNLSQLRNLFNNFGSVVEKDGWCFPAFNIPLQLLAFEAIPGLKSRYREKIRGVAPDCPRMCKSKFAKCSMTGFPLSELYETVGTTKNIQSVMYAEDHERPLFHRIFDSREDDVDVHDPILNSWINPLLKERRPVCFERLYNLDVIPLREAEAANVGAGANEAGNEGEDANVGANEAADEVAKVSAEVESQGKELLEVKENMMSLTKTVEDGLKKIFDLLEAQDKRLKGVESFVESQNIGNDFGFDDSPIRSRYGGGTSGGTSAGVTVGEDGQEKEKSGAGDGDGQEKEKSGAGDGDGQEKEKSGAGDGDDQEKEKSGAGDGDGQEKQKEKEKEKEKEKQESGDGQEKEKGQEKNKGMVIDGEEEFESCDEDDDMEDGNDVEVGEKRIRKPSAASKSPYVLMMPKNKRNKAADKKD